MAQLLLELPDTLHHQLESLAQREGVQLTQYILYILTHQVGSVYTVQITSEETVAEQEAAYQALRQQWGQASSTQVEEVLAKREEVEPEPELKPELIEKVRRRIEEQKNNPTPDENTASNF